MDAMDKFLIDVRTIAEWHLGDSDECGIIARRVLSTIGQPDLVLMNLLVLHARQRAIDECSPAQRILEQRDIDQQVERIKQALVQRRLSSHAQNTV